MRHGIGIDFGTTNSTVALYDGEHVRYLPLEPGDGGDVMPTALYLSRERQAAVGRAAIDRYTSENAGRTVRLAAEEVGVISMTVAGTESTDTNIEADGGAITNTFGVHAWTDQELPGRLFRSVKRWLGNSSLDTVRVFDRSYRVVALATPVLARMSELITTHAAGGAPIHVGRPIRYEGRNADANEIAVTRMTEACGHAGLRAIELFPEPIAAAFSYLDTHPLADGETALAFDFGGGTLDLSVVESRGGELVLRATHGIPIGGDEVDRRIYRDRVFPELGDGATVRHPTLDGVHEERFPFDLFGDRLLNWALAYELNRPELLESLAQGIRTPGEGGLRLARLYEVVRGNLSYAVFQAIERAKVALAGDDVAEIVVDDLDLRIRLDCEALDRIVAPLIDEAGKALDVVLSAADVDPECLTVVVRTGGSSRLRAATRLLEARFPGRVVEHDPFTSIAAGLAISSWRHGNAAH